MYIIYNIHYTVYAVGFNHRLIIIEDHLACHDQDNFPAKVLWKIGLYQYHVEIAISDIYTS